MLVDDHEPVLRFGDDVGCRDLAAGDSEGVARHRFDRRFRASVRSKGHRLERRLRFAKGGRAKRQNRLGLVALARGPQHRCRRLRTRCAALAFLVERVA